MTPSVLAVQLPHRVTLRTRRRALLGRGRVVLPASFFSLTKQTVDEQGAFSQHTNARNDWSLLELL